MSHHANIYTCTMPIPVDYLNKPVSPLPTVYIGYQLWYNKKVTIIRQQFEPGVGKNIKDWDSLEKDIQLAAEHHSKGQTVPGQEKGRRVEMEPLEQVEFENRLAAERY